MTQPPPPPNEPPQGGFGAPQDPPPGGFGAPTPPPQYGYPPQGQPPGYGYPGQQPPQPPPGYGYPGRPGGPGQQPPYGYPTQPQSPYPPPPQGGGNGGGRISTQMKIILAATVAVALIVVGGVYVANSGGDSTNDNAKNNTTSGADGGKDGRKDTDKNKGAGGGGKEKAPADVKSTMAFKLATPKVTDITNVKGAWLTDTTYVKTGVDEIVGYDPAKGTQLWSIPLPGQLCAATDHVKDNVTAIAFEAAKRTGRTDYQPCTEIGAVDLAAGKLLWRKSVTGPNAGDDKLKFEEITIGAATVALGGTEGGAALDLATGALRWKPQASADNCTDMGYGGGAGLVVARKCGSYEDPQVSIDNLNPVTGAPLSSYKMPPGVEYASVVSTKPLVVAADVGDTAGDGSGISDFFSIDENTGALRAKIPADADTYAADCATTEVESCRDLVVGNGRLYLPTEEHDGSGDYGQTNEIVSFDLATGRTTSDRADAGDRYTITPLRMDGGNLIAYKWPPYDKGGQIVSIDGSTFKETVLMENPADKAVREAETSFSKGYSEMRFGAGRLFISDAMLSKPSTLDLVSYLAVSFTTS
ncbi:outer membrane protein assembly factor BamB family protein [Streptomyces liangshanensis]|uniref:outer membrane protein assembly factor BamB family protein n=1 Tax=Streptomyces liangshanensis TaxID=2717324 RepID=UPI0036D91034